MLWDWKNLKMIRKNTTGQRDSFGLNLWTSKLNRVTPMAQRWLGKVRKDNGHPVRRSWICFVQVVYIHTVRVFFCSDVFVSMELFCKNTYSYRLCITILQRCRTEVHRHWQFVFVFNLTTNNGLPMMSVTTANLWVPRLVQNIPGWWFMFQFARY